MRYIRDTKREVPESMMVNGLLYQEKYFMKLAELIMSYVQNILHTAKI